MHACRLVALMVALAIPVLALPVQASPGSTPGAAPALTPASAADVLKAVRAPGARAVLVNVWATWCVPCREEMPDLLRLRHAYADRGLRLILVSGDFSDDAGQAAAFLGEQGVDFPTYLKKGPDMEFIDAFDPKWSGALPATFIYDADGHLRHTIRGMASYDQLEEKLRNVLQ